MSGDKLAEIKAHLKKEREPSWNIFGYPYLEDIDWLIERIEKLEKVREAADEFADAVNFFPQAFLNMGWEWFDKFSTMSYLIKKYEE